MSLFLHVWRVGKKHLDYGGLDAGWGELFVQSDPSSDAGTACCLEPVDCDRQTCSGSKHPNTVAVVALASKNSQSGCRSPFWPQSRL